VNSPRTAARLTRILAMLPWVIAHPGTTVDEVCSRFDYSPAQLGADLNLVFLCGLPGYGPGDLMDAYIDGDEVVVDMADYFSRPLRLTPAEALGLLASGMAVIGSGQAPEALSTAVAKLQGALLPPDEEVLIVDVPEPDLVDVLRGAAAAGEVVHIRYTAIATGETTERDIEPWSVFTTLGNWYVAGHCRRAGAERVFRVDRIRESHRTGERFEPPRALPEPEVRYVPGEGDVAATIRLGPRSRWVMEYYPVEVVEREPDTVIRFSTSDPSVAARLLLRLGADADLLEGPEVAASLADLRARILARY
jgi:proteasome accessory factor C